VCVGPSSPIRFLPGPFPRIILPAPSPKQVSFFSVFFSSACFIGPNISCMKLTRSSAPRVIFLNNELSCFIFRFFFFLALPSSSPSAAGFHELLLLVYAMSYTQPVWTSSMSPDASDSTRLCFFILLPGSIFQFFRGTPLLPLKQAYGGHRDPRQAHPPVFGSTRKRSVIPTPRALLALHVSQVPGPRSMISWHSGRCFRFRSCDAGGDYS